MKWLPVLVVLLVAAPASAQDVILGVLETGDFTITIDTTTFFWGVRPDAQFETPGWGGSAGTTDTFEFELLDTTFPPHVWIDYHRGGTAMARETIIGLIPDSWYELPRFDKAPTRIKFLRQPGIEEGSTPGARRYALRASPNPFRTRSAIRLSSSILQPSALCVYDACGNLVRILAGPEPLFWDGRDETGRELEAGVYVCRVRADASAPTLRLVKLD
jgi:hypothetical protein